MDIAERNRLPLVNLTESGGADLPNQAEVFVPGGASFRKLTQMSAANIPTITLVFGSSTAGGAYVPGMSDYIVMQKKSAKVFLAGPPLVKMAINEDAVDEDLGGAEMHARVSGLADYLAEDELDALRIGRGIVGHLNWRKLGPGSAGRRAGRAGARPRGAARHRQRGRAGALRHPRDHRPDRRRLPVRGVQGALRLPARHGLGGAGRLPGRDHRQQRDPVQRGVAEVRAVHPAVQPSRHPDHLPAEHHRLHGRAPATSSAASSRTAPS